VHRFQRTTLLEVRQRLTSCVRFRHNPGRHLGGLDAGNAER
jgi:hypothetical protein